MRYLLFLVLLSITSAHASEAERIQSLAAEVEQFAQADTAKPPVPCQVEFLGSSTIRVWGAALTTDMAPIPVINRGFGGSQMEDVNRWFDRLVPPYRPSAIVFYEGDNDIDAGKSVKRVLADFDTFMKLKSRALGATPVIFVSVKPSKARLDQVRKQAKVNRAVLKQTATRKDLRYIDIVPAMLDHGHPKDIFERDGLHMNRSGYEIWTRVIKPVLEQSYDTDRKNCERS
jgi:lysophospholipase L1-like esterase